MIGVIVPVYLSKHAKRDKHIDLMLLSEGKGDLKRKHYVWIKNMSRLVVHATKHKGTTYVCPHCVHRYTTLQSFNNHFPALSKRLHQIIQFPSEDDKIVQFKPFDKTVLMDFVVYADFESILIPSDEQHRDNNVTHVINTHKVVGFCIYTVSKNPEFQTDPILYSGEDCIDVFFETLIEEQLRIASILSMNIDMLPLTFQQQDYYNSIVKCPVCKCDFTEDNKKGPSS